MIRDCIEIRDSSNDTSVDLPLLSDFTVPLIDNRRADWSEMCHKMNIFLKVYNKKIGTSVQALIVFRNFCFIVNKKIKLKF